MRRIQSGVALCLVILLAVLTLAACGDTTSIEERFKQGNEFAQAGEFEKAIAEYEAVLKEDPDNISAMTNLGVVYYNTGRLDDAIAQYQKALELAPADADIHSNLAAAYVQKNQLDKALEEYQAAVKLNPELTEAHFGLGVVYVQMGQNDQAIQAFERFQELDSGKDPVASDQARQYLQQLKGQ